MTFLEEANSSGFCVGCGCPFLSFDPRQTRCRSDCKRQRSNISRNGPRNTARAIHEVEFIGVDGEGMDVGDDHHYVLLSIGDQAYHMDGAPLSLQFIFESLWAERLKHPKAAFVGFALGYDFSQWLARLPVNRAIMLYNPGIRARTQSGGNHRPFPVDWEDWQFDLMPGGKRFALSKGRRTPGRKVKAEWLYVCDTFAFWQSSFLKAIDPKAWPTPIVTAEEYEILCEGKSNRATAVFGPDMIRYNKLENEVLARAMSVLNKGFVNMGVRLPRHKWFGPGQAAQTWLNNIKAPTGEQVQEVTPTDVYTAARGSYFGGWFEITTHGHVPGVTYEYDINSAYPSIIRNLPCLLHGRWVHGGPRTKRSKWQLIYGSFSGDNARLGPHMHRRENGTVARMHTRGWAWRHEIDAAMTAKLVFATNIEETWTYLPCDCPPPIRDIDTLYNDRLRIGKASPHGKALKLVYNSTYGKMCQSVGIAKYANPVYASLITAGCRTKILEAIATHPLKAAGVVMIATDALYFRTPHPDLPMSEKLGEWGIEEKHNLTLFMPGVYWDDKTRQALAEGKTPSLKSRGVSGRHLAQVIESIDRQWDVWDPDLNDPQWPQATITIDFTVVTPKLALARHKWDTCGKVVHGITRDISADPITKRIYRPGYLKRWAPPYNEDYAWTTHCINGPFPITSTPYTKSLGDSMMEDPDAWASTAVTVEGLFNLMDVLKDC